MQTQRQVSQRFLNTVVFSLSPEGKLIDPCEARVDLACVSTVGRNKASPTPFVIVEAGGERVALWVPEGLGVERLMQTWESVRANALHHNTVPEHGIRRGRAIVRPT
jgi:hypothetical protein